MQLIYQGETLQLFSKTEFWSSFRVIANDHHFSNTQESIKSLEKVFAPYVRKKRSELDDPHWTVLLIWDVFWGQKTDPLLQILKENNILPKYIPSNMANYCQPLDLTTNKWAENFMKNKFAGWSSAQGIG